MIQTLHVKKLFIPLVSFAVFAALVLTPLTASAEMVKVGSFSAKQVGTYTPVSVCKTYKGNKVTMSVRAIPEDNNYLLYKTLNLTFTKPGSTESTGHASTTTWLQLLGAKVTATAERGSIARVYLSTPKIAGIPTTGPMQIMSNFQYDSSHIKPAKTYDCN